jgi:AAA domain
MPPSRRAAPISGAPIRNVSKGRSTKLSVMQYGEPGIGKTVLVGTSGKLGKTLIIRPPVDHTDSIEDTSNVDEWVVNDWTAMDDVLLYVRTDGWEKYEWIWLDSLTLWSDQGIDDIWEQLIDDKPHRARWGLDKGEYWLNMQRIQRWVRHMVGTPGFHFGMTAHVDKAPVSENEEDTEEKLMPAIQGKNMPSKMCGYMNVVGYYHWESLGRSKTPTRVLSLDSTPDYYAKDQFSSTEGGRIVNPTMPKLVEAIVAKHGSKNGKPPSSRRTSRRRATTK